MTVLVSQRVDIYESRGEVRDAVDSAWYGTLVSLFGDERIVPVPNYLPAARHIISGGRVDMVVLTGGNDLLTSSPDIGRRDKVERHLMQWTWDEKVPVLGVCRGFQHMNLWLGGQNVPCQGHIGKPHSVFDVEGASAFNVNSYHGMAIAPPGLADSLQVLLSDDDGNIESACLSGRSWLGVMWHPERSGGDAERQAAFIKAFFGERQKHG